MNKEEIVVQKLIDKKYHISCAESCTRRYADQPYCKCSKCINGT